MAHLDNNYKHHNMDNSSDLIEKLEHPHLGYGEARGTRARIDVAEEDNPNIYQHMNAKLFTSLVAMSFLWVGSQIPLYLFGSILPAMYTDIGGYDIYLWMIIGYLIPCSALCPFVGALSDMFGRRSVGAAGQVLLIIGPIVTSTAKTMNTAIVGQVISGLGAGLNELTALAGTSEMVPKRKRGAYVGAVVFTIVPFCPSVLWAQLITQSSTWRYVGLLVGLWNFVGLVLVLGFYKDPARNVPIRPKSEVLREVDYVGGFLSTAGVTCFMLGLQFGAAQYTWHSAHVLAPFVIGIVILIGFFVWEYFFAPYPMVPARILEKSPRSMIAVLLITFFSGANFFVLLLFWPTEVYNVYGPDPIGIGIRSLPIGFGIIGGAVIALVMIPVAKGRTTPLMVFWTCLMTAGTGAISIARPDNLGTVYGLLTIASIGVGGVIIPCSIIAQLCCPEDLIGTITAITLSIRYIGGAIGFTAYYSVFFHKFTKYASTQVAITIIEAGVQSGSNITLITELITLTAQAQYGDVQTLIQTTSGIPQAIKPRAFDIILGAVQQAMALAYRYPYWISIAFGSVCIISSLFLKDVRHFVEEYPGSNDQHSQDNNEFEMQSK